VSCRTFDESSSLAQSDMSNRNCQTHRDPYPFQGVYHSVQYFSTVHLKLII